MTPSPRPARLTAALSLSVLMALLATLLGPTPASQATITNICTGYDGCKDRGYGNGGYQKANDRMYWQMYSGHNCTNYAAYRMVKSGLRNERPWSGSGNAMYWGTEMRRITDDRPMVGAVAWWKANVAGAGSVGHVAYVERVLSRRRIVVSEDSWGGDFGWKVVTRDGSGWPSGFIHFNDRKVRSTRAPEIIGKPVIGTEIRVRAGRWRPDARVAVQWYAGGEPIAGARDKTFTPGLAERRKRLSVRVTATARGFVPGVVRTQPTARVARGTLRPDVAPTIVGTPRVDEVLELQGGSVTPSAADRAYRWYSDGERIAGADTRRLRLTQEQIRRHIEAAVISRREGYRRHVATAPRTASVEAGKLKVTAPFEIDGAPQRGRTLAVTPGRYKPGDAEVHYTWLRDGEAISKADGRSYAATVDDVGHRLSVRVSLSRRGYRDRALRARTDGIVTTAPALRARAEGRPGRAIVRLRVGAPGVENPRGEAAVRVGQRRVTGTVVDGRLRVVVGGLPPGSHGVRVSYSGTAVVLPARATTEVRVPRR